MRVPWDLVGALAFTISYSFFVRSDSWIKSTPIASAGLQQSKIGHSDSMGRALYDQFILFGDSLFQHSSNQQQGWSLAPALQNGEISNGGEYG